MDILTKEQIKQLYPNQWVLIGNPQLGNPRMLGSIISKLESGVVIYGSPDKREIAYKAKDLRKGFETYTCVFTGQIPKNRRFWL